VAPPSARNATAVTQAQMNESATKDLIPTWTVARPTCRFNRPTGPFRGTLVLGVASRWSYAENIGVRLVNLVLVLAAALLAVSAAVAKEGPRPGMAGDSVTRSGCTPKRTLVLKGRFMAGGLESFQMNVMRASSHARALRGARELRFDTRTRFRRNGAAATLTSLQPNDRLHVLVRGCKRAQALGMELTARRVVAHAPRPSS
jgi:hypothetical protein